MTTSSARLALSFVSAALAAAAAAQGPTFKNNVNAVLLDVRVVDADGRFVDVKPGDLAVFEDGKPQEVTTFERVEIPIDEDERPLFDGKPVDADVASNTRGEGRLYVLLLDDFHTHPFRSATVRALAREFIEKHFTEADRAVVVTTSGRSAVVQEFTNNRKRLADLIDKFEGGFQASTRCTMVTPSGNEVPNARTGVMVALQGAVDSSGCQIADDRSSLETLSSLAAWLGGVAQQRKAIVFISEGFDGRISNAFDEPEDDIDAYLDDLTGGSVTRSKRSNDAMVISDDLRRVLDTAARSNVSIYAIDPTGDPNQPSSGGVKPQPMLADENPFDNKHQQNRLMLQALAVSTGGVALTRSNDFAATLAKVVADSSSYYLLGFVSTNAAQDGTYRKIEVRPVRAGLKVQARSGYTARNSAPVKGAAPLISATLSELMSTPAQVSGLSLGVAAPAYMGKGSKAQVEVIVELAGSDIMPDANAAPSDKPLEVLIAIADADGRVKAKEQGSLQLNFSAPVRAQISQYGLRLMSRLDVAPGRYLLRIAGTEPGGSARGSVQYDLDVPDFSKARLSMSGLALASSTELRRATTGSDAEWKRRFPLAPTTVRVFPVGAELSVAGEIYALDKPAAGIVITTAVRNESGDVVARHEETLTNADSGKPATYRHQTEFSLLGFAPGAYVLSVEARTSTAPKPVTRDIPFSVR